MPPTMEEMAVPERARINRAIATARSAVGAVGDAATDAQVTAAENALSALQATINAASNVPEHERNAHTATHGLIEADLTAAKMSRDMAMKAAEDKRQEEQTAMAEETRATAQKLFNAIERDREIDVDNPLRNPLRLTRSVRGPQTIYSIRSNPFIRGTDGIDPDGGGKETTVDGEANSIGPKDDIAGKELPELAGWKGGEYVYEHADCETTAFPGGCEEGIRDHLVIYTYTNQADAEPAPANPQTFAERYGVDSNDDGTLDNAWYMPETPTQKAHITNDGLTANDVFKNWPLITSNMFATAGAKVHTREDDPETESIDESMISIRGAFDGAAGVYTCKGTEAEACMSTYLVGDASSRTPEEGTPYILLTGGGDDGWTFTVDNANAMVTTDENEATETILGLWYGWWAREMPGDDGWFDVRPITTFGPGGKPPSANAVAAAIKGSATYTGGAAGKYAIYYNNPVADGLSAGAWTADAMLKADFDNGKVSGELTSFMVGGQAMDWKVELLESGDINGTVTPGGSRGRIATLGEGGFQLDGSNHGFSNAENGTVWTMGGMAGDKAGSWYGDFWAEEGTTVDSTAANNPAPESATGVFWAEHGNTARMTGAFGVTRDEGN